MEDINWSAVLAAGFVSYWIGSISPADAAARMRGADLRGTGSGNPGATNAARTMGVRVGVIVGLIDVVKGFLPVWYFGRYGDPAGQVAGLAAVIGHITSPFLQGRGGKGVATSLGAILALNPLWAIPVLVAFGVTVAITRRVGIGSVVGGLALIPTTIVDWESWADAAFAIGLSALIIYRHRRNVSQFWSEVRSR
ncbi:MAG: glycerol-3-phosphate 1-O-acyltransferase PlsY [Candidatus Nanopelagicales bacterium]